LKSLTPPTWNSRSATACRLRHSSGSACRSTGAQRRVAWQLTRYCQHRHVVPYDFSLKGAKWASSLRIRDDDYKFWVEVPASSASGRPSWRGFGYDRPMLRPAKLWPAGPH
jgi:hypothetical protein